MDTSVRTVYLTLGTSYQIRARRPMARPETCLLEIDSSPTGRSLPRPGRGEAREVKAQRARPGWTGSTRPLDGSSYSFVMRSALAVDARQLSSRPFQPDLPALRRRWTYAVYFSSVKLGVSRQR